MMPTFSDLLGPLLGFLFTTFTLVFIAATGRWLAEREDLTGLDRPPGTPEVPAAPPSPAPTAEHASSNHDPS